MEMWLPCMWQVIELEGGEGKGEGGEGKGGRCTTQERGRRGGRGEGREMYNPTPGIFITATGTRVQ